MTQTVLKLLLWFCAIGCGLVAGVYFAFSTFVMTALGLIDASHAVATFNSINSTILRSLFMPLFFGTTLASFALVLMALVGRGKPGSAAILAGGLIYVTGMFLCTMFFNVPLNNVLAGVDPSGADAAIVWARFFRNWVMWNHLRTLASTAACVLYISALSTKSATTFLGQP